MVSMGPPSGFRDFLNDEAAQRLKMIHTIVSVYESFGFMPLETPALEDLSLLLGRGGGDENEKLIFKILKRGEKLEQALASSPDENRIAEFGLRFDLTLPLSRVVAGHRGKIKLPWKVFHMGPVWRAERAQKGRFREFIQCDVDIIGAKGIGAEAEVIQAVVAAVDRLGASGFELRLNDRRLIQSIAQKLGFAGEKLESFAVLMDKKDKLPIGELRDQLIALNGGEHSQEVTQILENQLSLDGASAYHPEAAASLNSLSELVRGLQLPLRNIVFDPSLVRGMGYYTGTVFELRHASAGYSFGGGGRYDQLIGKLSGEEIPACGFSIGFERLALLIAEAQKETSLRNKTLFVPVFDEALRGQVLALSSTLRKSGIAVDVFPDRAKIKNQFKYASDNQFRWLLIAGQEECATQVFKLKDFSTGVETSVPQSELLEKLKSVL